MDGELYATSPEPDVGPLVFLGVHAVADDMRYVVEVAECRHGFVGQDRNGTGWYADIVTNQVRYWKQKREHNVSFMYAAACHAALRASSGKGNADVHALVAILLDVFVDH